MEYYLNVFVIGFVLCSLFVRGDHSTRDLLESSKFSAIYNFGDSNSDTGANSVAFYPIESPNGETFFGKAAGRASDGRLINDFIANYLHLPHLSPYLDSMGSNFKHGANFASGGSTIIKPNTTIFQSGRSPFSLDIQVVQFRQFKARASAQYKKGCVRNFPTPDSFSKSLYAIDIGQNDIADELAKNNDYVHMQASIHDMVDQLVMAIKNLYGEGARAFWIHNTGPIGCLPYTLTWVHNPKPGYLDQYGCIKSQNDVAIEFNKQLKDRVIELKDKLTEAVFTYVDIFETKFGLIKDANKQGFMDANKICCGYYKGETRVWCGRTENINGTDIYGASCGNPSGFISWDGVHYTEAANKWIARRILNASLPDSYIENVS